MIIKEKERALFSNICLLGISRPFTEGKILKKELMDYLRENQDAYEPHSLWPKAVGVVISVAAGVLIYFIEFQ